MLSETIKKNSEMINERNSVIGQHQRDLEDRMTNINNLKEDLTKQKEEMNTLLLKDEVIIFLFGPYIYIYITEVIIMYYHPPPPLHSKTKLFSGNTELFCPISILQYCMCLSISFHLFVFYLCSEYA